MAMQAFRSPTSLYPERFGRLATMPSRKESLAIVSTGSKLCGVGAYTAALRRQLGDAFDITVFDLDQYLLRSPHRRVRKQRVVENLVHAIEILGVGQVAPVVNDRTDRFAGLYAAQLAGYSVGQEMRSMKIRLHPNGGLELEPHQSLGKTRGIEHRRHQKRVESDGQSRRRVGEPAEPPVDVGALAAQGAVLKLQVDDIEPPDRTADILDVPVCEPGA